VALAREPLAMSNPSRGWMGALRSGPATSAETLFDAMLLAALGVHAFMCISRPMDYVPDDALFYYQIAFNIAQGHGASFSNLMPTNGFHPFWLLLCIPVAWLAGSKDLLFLGVRALVVVLNVTTLLALRAFLRRRHVPYASAAILVGAPYLFFVYIGMEGHLAALWLVLTMGAAHAFLENPTTPGLYRVAACGAGLVFARLDLAILIAPLALLIADTQLRRPLPPLQRAAGLAAASLLAALPVGAFMALNLLQFGDPRPISGSLKMMGAEVTELDGIALLYLGATLVGGVAALLGPASSWTRIHLCLTIGALFFWVYVTRFTTEAYSWYFYPWAVTAICGTAMLFQRLSGSAWRNARVVPPIVASNLPLVLLALAGGASLLGTGLMGRYGWPDRAGYTPPSRAVFEEHAPIERVFAFDRAGELAYFDDLSVLAADGLTTNMRFQRELAQKGIAWALDTLEIQAVVVPRMGEGSGYRRLCGRMYMEVIRFRCELDDDPDQITALEIFSKLTGEALGVIDLRGKPRFELTSDREVVLLPPRSESPLRDTSRRHSRGS
jgi:hypothetical protein